MSDQKTSSKEKDATPQCVGVTGSPEDIVPDPIEGPPRAQQASGDCDSRRGPSRK
jgi:hypothetical protein